MEKEVNPIEEIRKNIDEAIKAAKEGGKLSIRKELIDRIDSDPHFRDFFERLQLLKFLVWQIQKKASEHDINCGLLFTAAVDLSAAEDKRYNFHIAKALACDNADIDEALFEIVADMKEFSNSISQMKNEAISNYIKASSF